MRDPGIHVFWFLFPVFFPSVILGDLARRSSAGAKAAAQDLALAFESASKFDLEPLMIVATVDAGVTQLAVQDTVLTAVARALTASEADQHRAKRHAEILAQSDVDAIAGCGLSHLAKGVLRGTDQLLETLKHAI